MEKIEVKGCKATPNDSGHTHYGECYCNLDQGAGYTYSDEYGDCEFCEGNFVPGVVICADESNVMRVCPVWRSWFQSLWPNAGIFNA